jgi:hypothetical protein
MPAEAVDLVSRLLQYSPNLRSTAVSTNTTSLCELRWGMPFSTLITVVSLV